MTRVRNLHLHPGVLHASTAGRPGSVPSLLALGAIVAVAVAIAAIGWLMVTRLRRSGDRP
ncbi:MAG TPA: hypothetical protein VMB82_10535 [Acidimicrobiales bacterium]|nr:hypothetical protein [Acidimicrobiales bacterium]